MKTRILRQNPTKDMRIRDRGRRLAFSRNKFLPIFAAGYEDEGKQNI
ncbi:MAG: hypothetical protein ACPLY9_05445 [Nitrososphaerales archaeon]